MPAFYRQLAQDTTGGAVLDLPHGWYNRQDRASAYMYYQTIHGHPIAWSYLSRSHVRFPNPGLDPLWNLHLPAGRDLRARPPDLRDGPVETVVSDHHPAPALIE